MLGIIVVFALIILIDIKQLKKSKSGGWLLPVYIILIIACLTISILLATGNRPASPPEMIESFLNRIGVDTSGGE